MTTRSSDGGRRHLRAVAGSPVRTDAQGWVIPPDPMALSDEQAAEREQGARGLVPRGDAEVSHYSGDLLGGPVDPPEAVVPLAGRIVEADQAEAAFAGPVLPAGLRSPSEFWSVSKAACRRAGRWLAWHGVRAPWYLVLTLALAVVGVARSVWWLWKWCWDLDGMDERREARHGGREMVGKSIRLQEQRKETVRRRWGTTGGVAAVLAALGAVAYWLGQPWRLILLGVLVAGLITLAWIGRPKSVQVFPVRTEVRGRWTRLTADSVRIAMLALGIARIKEPGDVTFPQEIQPSGPGHLALIRLPDGVTAGDVIKKREILAGAFGIPLDQLFVTTATGRGAHPGLVEVFVLDKPASEMTREEWPRWSLTMPNARTSVFKPFPFAHDERFRPVSTALFELNFLVGGRPGSGKSAFLRVLLAAALLDPICEVKVAELKGVGDFIDLEPLCSTYIVGVGEDEVRQVYEMLLWLLKEVNDRGARVRKAYQAGLLKEQKVSPEVAAMPGSGLHPIVAAIDEAHEAFTDPVYGKECKALADRVVKRGRALAVILLVVTQIPDGDSLPANMVRSIGARICCAVSDHIAVNMILGSGSYAAGYHPTTLRPELDAAWGYFKAVQNPRLVHAYYPLTPDWRRMVARMTELRGGRRVGSPIVLDDVEPPRDVLVDVIGVFDLHPEWSGAQWPELLAGLKEISGTYGSWNLRGLQAALGPLEIASTNVRRGAGTAKGCKREAVEAAIQARQLTAGEGVPEDVPDEDGVPDPAHEPAHDEDDEPWS